MSDVGLGLAPIEHRRAKRPKRAHNFLRLLDRARIAARDDHHVLPVELGGMNGSGRALRWTTTVISSSGASALHSR